MAYDPLTTVLEIGGKVIDRLFPDPTEKAKAQLELFRLQQTGELAQITAQTRINEEEAKSSSVFIAGWRPFLGWVCGAAFASNYVIAPISMAIGESIGHAFQYPLIDLQEMLPVLLGMLGLGAYRTYEKVTKSESNR